jgi:hypothetical protein
MELPLESSGVRGGVELRELFLLGIFLGKEVVRETTGLNWVRAASGLLLYFKIGEEEGEEEGESVKW